MKTEFYSLVTGEVGNFAYVLRNLIAKNAMGKRFLNLEWRKLGKPIRKLYLPFLVKQKSEYYINGKNGKVSWSAAEASHWIQIGNPVEKWEWNQKGNEIWKTKLWAITKGVC